MNLKTGTALFKRLVRAADLDTEIADPSIDLCLHRCEDHGWVFHYYYIVGDGFEKDPPVCRSCMFQSRALSSVGRAGGRKGGKALTPRKLDQLRAASRAASDKARERRAAADDEEAGA